MNQTYLILLDILQNYYNSANRFPKHAQQQLQAYIKHNMSKSTTVRRMINSLLQNSQFDSKHPNLHEQNYLPRVCTYPKTGSNRNNWNLCMDNKKKHLFTKDTPSHKPFPFSQVLTIWQRVVTTIHGNKFLRFKRFSKRDQSNMTNL